MSRRPRYVVRSALSLIFALGLIASAGCGDDPSQTDDTCSEHTDCADAEACFDEVCVDAPEEGDSCTDEQEGDTFENLTCENGTWQGENEVDIRPDDLAVVTEPPAQVASGESFAVAIEVREQTGSRMPYDGMDIELSLNHGQFADGAGSATETTDEGLAEFDLVIDEPAEDFVLTATGDHEDLEGVSTDTQSFDVVGASGSDLEFATEPPAEVTAGETFEATVALVDGDGESVEQSGVDVTVVLNQGQFADGSDEATVATDNSGHAGFELVVEQAGTGLVLTATAGGAEFDGATANSQSFDVVAAGADAENSSITGEDGVEADGVQEAEITIELFDAYGNPVVGVVPEFEATGSGNSYGDCSETDSDGVAVCSMTSTEAEEKTLEIVAPIDATGETIEFVLACDEEATPFGGGAGTADDPHVLCTSDHLAAIGAGDYETDHFAVAADIDMAGVADFDIIGHTSDSLEMESWFSGRFDGRGHTISNLTIDEPTVDYVGMFGLVDNDGVVENIHLQNVDVTGSERVGGLVGWSRGTIENVTVDGAAIADTFAGGIAGFLDSDEALIADSDTDVEVESASHSAGGVTSSLTGTISNSQATGPVTASGGSVGGLAGNMRNNSESLIADSSATGDVTGDGWYVGGLVGDFEDGTIEHSSASGDVEGGGRRVGGLVGGSADGTIHTSHATGQVQAGTIRAGGLVGDSTRDAITESYATGAVEAESSVGGLIGYMSEGTVSDSYATGPTTGNYRIAGLVGRVLDSSLSRCYATGAVDADPVDDDSSDIGGVAADTVDNTADALYWDEETTGVAEGDDIGGIGAPLVTADFEDDTNFDGWDFDSIWEIGEAPDGQQRPVLQGQ